MNIRILPSLFFTVSRFAALLFSPASQAGTWKEIVDYGRWDLVEERAGRKLTACYDATLWGKKLDHARLKLWSLRLDALADLHKEHKDPQPRELCTLLAALDEREDIKTAIEEKRRIKIKTWGRVLESKSWEEAEEILQQKYRKSVEKENLAVSILNISRTVLWRSRLQALLNLRSVVASPDQETLSLLLGSIDEEEKVKSDLAYYLKNKQAALENASLRSLYMEIPDGSDADLPRNILEDLAFEDDPQEGNRFDRKEKEKEVDGEQRSSGRGCLKRTHAVRDVSRLLAPDSPYRERVSQGGIGYEFGGTSVFQSSTLSEEEAIRLAMKASLESYATKMSGDEGASSSAACPSRSIASSSSSFHFSGGASSSGSFPARYLPLSPLAQESQDGFDKDDLNEAIRRSLEKEEA